MPASDAELLRDTVRAAGELGLALGAKQNLRHWTKPDGSQVTEGDLAINTLLERTGARLGLDWPDLGASPTLQRRADAPPAPRPLLQGAALGAVNPLRKGDGLREEAHGRSSAAWAQTESSIVHRAG